MAQYGSNSEIENFYRMRQHCRMRHRACQPIVGSDDHAMTA